MTSATLGGSQILHGSGHDARWPDVYRSPIARSGMVLFGVGWSLVIIDALVVTISSGGAYAFPLGRVGQTAVASGLAFVVLSLLLVIARNQGARHDAIVSTEDRLQRVLSAQAARQPSSQTLAVNSDTPEAERKSERKPTSSATSAATLIVARGVVDDRGFLLLADGSIVIETLLGQRRFRALADAQDFIGGGKFVLHDTVQIALGPSEQQRSHAAAIPAGRLLAHV